MTVHNIVSQVNLQTAALVRKGFLDVAGSTDQHQFWQKLHHAAVKVLNTRDTAVDRLPYSERNVQITASSQAINGHQAVTHQFRFLLHVPTAQLFLSGMTTFFDKMPSQALSWKASDGEIADASFYYKELTRLYDTRPSLPRNIHLPSSGSRRSIS